MNTNLIHRLTATALLACATFSHGRMGTNHSDKNPPIRNVLDARSVR